MVGMVIPRKIAFSDQLKKEGLNRQDAMNFNAKAQGRKGFFIVCLSAFLASWRLGGSNPLFLGDLAVQSAFTRRISVRGRL
jgi:hypothetical protein